MKNFRGFPAYRNVAHGPLLGPTLPQNYHTTSTELWSKCEPSTTMRWRVVHHAKARYDAPRRKKSASLSHKLCPSEFSHTNERNRISTLSHNKRTMSTAAQSNKNNVNKRRGKYEEPAFLVKPVTIQVIKPPRGTMNHSYRDFSQVPPPKGYVQLTEIKDMTFSQKVHHILSNPENEKWISWMPHGRSFKVHVPVMFGECLIVGLLTMDECSRIAHYFFYCLYRVSGVPQLFQPQEILLLPSYA